MYWNSERIYVNLENWMIFAKVHNEETVGCVYFMTDDDGWYEIYGIDLKDNLFDPKTFRNLLEKALYTAKEIGGKFMTFFCDEEGQEIVKELGFECVGEYVCYKKAIN